MEILVLWMLMLAVVPLKAAWDWAGPRFADSAGGPPADGVAIAA